ARGPAAGRRGRRGGRVRAQPGGRVRRRHPRPGARVGGPGMNRRRLWAVVLKELRQIRRDRISMALIMIIPIIDLLLFGYAINFNPRNLDAAIADQAMTATSRAAVMDINATGVIRTTAVAETPQELVDMLRRGQVSVGIVVPPDFDRRLAARRPALQVMVDGTDTVVQ